MTFYDFQNQPRELPQDATVDWRISGYAIVQNAEGEFLVVLPAFRTSSYDFPGGGIERSETIAEGVIRECYEESGYKIKLDSELPVYISENNFYHTDEDKFYHSVNLYFRCSLTSDEQDVQAINVAEPGEIDSVHWKSREELNSDNLYDMHYKALESLRSL